MDWQDKGYLLSINSYNENSAILEIFTENHGKTSGILFGSRSKKIKNYLFIGNKFHVNYSSKFEGKIGSFKLEPDSINTPLYLNIKKKFFCIVYSINLVKLLTVDNQENNNLFLLLDNFFEFVKSENWLSMFVLWELEIFKTVGYDINFNDYVDKIVDKVSEKYIVKNTNKEIPSYLINKNTSNKNTHELILGLKILGDYLDKTILRPNNINYPSSRIDFINSLK
tara:strand:- start:417 stop:1091 length:675 start_codon:yes stop_codon:yes gene_type:complete